jgi:hypothetical protein
MVRTYVLPARWIDNRENSQRREDVTTEETRKLDNGIEKHYSAHVSDLSQICQDQRIKKV